jgi:glycyl-tRNA synthetase beta chain
MSELFIEIITEEVPFIEQARQRDAVASFFAKTQELSGTLEVLCSRERLVIKLVDFAREVVVPSKYFKGPSLNAGEDALRGFLKKVNASKQELKEENGFYTFTSKEEKKDLKLLLEGGLILDLFNKIRESFSKTMRWNGSNKLWIRPIKSILTSINGDLIDFEYAGVKSSIFQTRIYSDCILNQNERLAKIKAEVKQIEEAENIFCVAKERLFEENSYLANLPCIKYSYFDEKYLNLPEKVLIQTLESNQKYFLFKNKDGSLSNLFAVCIDGKFNEEVYSQIIEGNKKVLHSRLEDAVYYVKIDRRESLLSHLEKTKKVAFHKDAGTIFDRVERMLEIARKLDPENKDLVLAIRLSKADLQTEMTQSFTELQGYIGAYYAHLEGYSTEICKAIELQYKLGVDEEPKGKDYLSLMLALIEKYEKIDTLLKAGELPTSSRDPFGIRRDALAIVKIIIQGCIDVKFTFKGVFESIILDRLSFYLKDFDREIITGVINFEKQKGEISILQIFHKASLLMQNKTNFAELIRVYKILQSKDAQTLKGFTLKRELLTKSEVELMDKFTEAKNLEDILSLSTLIDSFFVSTLVIDASNLELSQNRVALLEFVLKKVESFISFSS